MDHLPRLIRLTRLTWLLALSLYALLFANMAHASLDYVSGYFWKNSDVANATRFNTAMEACEALKAAELAYRRGSSWPNWQIGAITINFNSPPNNAICNAPRDSAGDGVYESTWANGVVRGTCTVGTDCPTPPVDCSVKTNVLFGSIAENQNATFVAPDTGCFAGCGAFKKRWKVRKIDGTTGDAESSRNLNPNGTYNYLVKYQYTGLACAAEPTNTTTPISTPTGPGGTGPDQFAEAPSGEGCGWVNGKYACYKSLQPDKCWVNGDGSRLCAESAPTPPKPLNAEGTAAATPDSRVEVCTGANACQTFTYYNSSTNAAAGQPSSNSGDTANEGPGTGTAGTGPGAGGVGDGTGDGGGTSGGATWCDTPPTCEGDPVACAQLVQQWRTMCPDEVTDEQVLDAMGATPGERDGSAFFGDPVAADSWSSSGPINVGSCPAPLSINVMGQSLSMDIWQRGCDMALLFSPVVMALAYFFGALILFRSNW